MLGEASVPTALFLQSWATPPVWEAGCGAGIGVSFLGEGSLEQRPDVGGDS